MRLQPAPHARFAVRQADLVILDLRAGVYACLPEAGGAVSLDALGLDVRDDALAQVLRAEGLLTETASHPLPIHPGAVPIPRRDLLDDRLRGGPREIAVLGFAYAAMAGRFRGRSFAQVIDQAHRGVLGRRDAAEPSLRARRQVACFWRWLPWAPFQGQCLWRSFLLLNALRARGEDAWWVFGVQTWPFEAHCWLQIGEVVLDDAAERVAAFTPILVI